MEGGVPLQDLPPAIEARLAELGGRPVNLYRALAANPEMLSAWIEFAWAVRQKPAVPRRLRELMIVRGADIAHCEYELVHHTRMAATNGVSAEDLEALPRWRESDRFSDRERAGLALMEAIFEGSVPDAVNAEVGRLFSTSERIELTMTAGLYCMVPRVLDALRVPLETEGARSPEG